MTRGANSTLAKLGLKAVKAVRGEDSKGRGQLEEVAQLKFGRLGHGQPWTGILRLF